MLSEREIMTPDEAADFLRLSRSTIYQRPDIPRYRLPGSRQIRFLRSELLAWMRGEVAREPTIKATMDPSSTQHKPQRRVVDNEIERVYHRNARYR